MDQDDMPSSRAVPPFSPPPLAETELALVIDADSNGTAAPAPDSIDAGLKVNSPPAESRSSSGGNAVVMAHREKWRRRVISLPWQMLIVITALGELSLLIAEQDRKKSSRVLTALSAFILSVFAIDIAVRIYIYRRYFCSHFANILDASLVGE